MGEFFNQCRQVWQSWARWPVFRLAFWIMAIQWLATVFLLNLELQQRASGRLLWWWTHSLLWWWTRYFDLEPLASFFDLMIPVLLAVAVPVMIVWRLKHQMTSWRAALTPDYRAPHLLVAAAIGAAIFLVMAVAPAALHALTNGLWWMRDDCRVVFVEAGEWRGRSWYVRQERDLQVPTGYLAYSNYMPSLLTYLDALPVRSLACLLLAEAVIAWLAAWVRTWIVLVAGLGLVAWIGGLAAMHMNYENWHFYVPMMGFAGSNDWDYWSTPAIINIDCLLLVGLWLHLGSLRVAQESVAADERVPWLSELLVNVNRRREGEGGLMSAGLWRRAGHRRLMGLGRRFVWLAAIYTAGLIFITPLVYNLPGQYAFGAFSLPGVSDRGEFAFGAFFMAGMVSSLAIGLSWPQRFAELNEVELMRPAPREQSAREIGVAMLFDAAELWLALLLAVVLATFYWMPASFQTTAFWHLFAAAILAQVFTFGLLVWTMLLRSTSSSAIALAIAIISFAMLLYIAMDERMIAPAVAAAGIGIVLAAHAYHRWLRADML
jgi:hypothetical protein